MITVYLGLGANLGNPVATVNAAILKLQHLEGISSLRSSSLYRTAPISPIAQPDFINAVVEFETALTLEALWTETQSIETSLGKRPKGKDEARPIDIDILLFGDLVCDEELEIPHPRMLERLFVLKPLSDLTPTIRFGENLVYLESIIARLGDQSLHPLDSDYFR